MCSTVSQPARSYPAFVTCVSEWQIPHVACTVALPSPGGSCTGCRFCGPLSCPRIGTAAHTATARRSSPSEENPFVHIGGLTVQRRDQRTRYAPTLGLGFGSLHSP